MLNNIIKKYTTPQGLWRCFWVVFSNFMMGVCLSLMVIANMGTDPCSFMNMGVAPKLHLSFGNWQLLMNVIMIVFVIIYKRNMIGLGTLVNMSLIGYVVDFFGAHVWTRVPFFNGTLSFGSRFAILIPTLLLFLVVVSIYMVCEMGMSPYDALPWIITEKTKLPFRWVRMGWDLTAVLIGCAVGGHLGILTVLMVISLGPVVAWFEKHVASRMFKEFDTIKERPAESGKSGRAKNKVVVAEVKTHA